ncbi:MAG: imidazole glycerol phosphate synthase subunit HisF [Nitrosopumilus sp.]|nr:imidazole glycerol phosphate synthase subunit HisF [Nitrosopumilus sp.]MDA7999148.1 imidazole glycerol phosphate synthase subunit HisF [Nitrosopumilus sp.]
MAPTRRVIPCLDVRGGRAVKGTNFGSLRDAGDPVELAARYSAQGADELVFLDITASEERRGIIAGMVRAVASVIDIPFTVGGGVSSVRDAREILLSGADKVGVNSGAVGNPGLLSDLAAAFGRQCVVAAIDAKRRPDGTYGVHTHGGKRDAGLDAVRWAAEAASLGAGEILLTSMDRDGTGDGYDLALTRAVSEAVTVPVVASGGCGSPGHMAEALSGPADAALAASIFHYDSHGVRGVKEFLRGAGIPVRL